MKQRSPAFVIGLITSIILGFGIIAGVVLSLQSAVGLGYEPSGTRATKTGSNTAELDLATFPDSHVCHADQGEPQIDWVSDHRWRCSGEMKAHFSEWRIVQPVPSTAIAGVPFAHFGKSCPGLCPDLRR